MNRNTASLVLRRMNNPKNIRAFSRTMMKLGANERIKENAAKRVVGIRGSELYRRRKAAMLNWARKFNKNEINRLLALPSPMPYTKRINSIPNPPITRTHFIKSIIARYLINTNVPHENAVQAVQRFHNAYGRPTQRVYNRYGRLVLNRIPNAQLVNYVMGLPMNRLQQLNNNIPFYG